MSQSTKIQASQVQIQLEKELAKKKYDAEKKIKDEYALKLKADAIAHLEKVGQRVEGNHICYYYPYYNYYSHVIIIIIVVLIILILIGFIIIITCTTTVIMLLRVLLVSCNYCSYQYKTYTVTTAIITCAIAINVTFVVLVLEVLRLLIYTDTTTTDIAFEKKWEFLAIEHSYYHDYCHTNIHITAITSSIKLHYYINDDTLLISIILLLLVVTASLQH